MNGHGLGGTAQRDVAQIVRRVRRRWRLRLALRGLTAVVGIGGSAFFISAMALEWLRFTPEAVVALRIATWSATTLAAGWFLVRPLLRRVTDRQAALYLEEREPSLEHAVATALDANAARDSTSPDLADLVARTALERVRGVRYGSAVEQSALFRWTGLLGAVTVGAVGLALTGPLPLRHGLNALLLPTRDAAAVNPYSVAVEPGDATIARGSDQMVAAALDGFDAQEASVFVRDQPDAPFRRLSMLPADSGGFELMLLDVRERTEYYVESTGVRSAIYALDVADLPHVDRLDLTYHFPRYTGLRSRTVKDGGNVAALPGTVVEVRVQPTMRTPGGRLRIDGGPAADLTVEDDGTLIGRFTVSAPGSYAVELATEAGALVEASPEYVIDVLDDRPPSVRITQPGRDAPASPIEEVDLDVRADDDYGVGEVRVVYSVNGRAPDTVPLFRASGAPLRTVATGYTFFLEEWKVEPGDLVSYYAVARDGRKGGPEVASDIYFLNIRPFERVYRQAEQQGGPSQGGGGQTQEAQLSELERQIIAATFNLVRRKATYGRQEFSENVVSVALAQGRLQEQVETLVARMASRGLTESDPGARDVSAILPRATEAMRRARQALDREALDDALPLEQIALRHLQQAEETYERYVTEQSRNAAGAGGGAQPQADDLADLFELELDKLKNQYETVQRGARQRSDQQVDEVLERLRELARRQEQETERQRRRAQAGQRGGGGAAQRALAEQAEEAARQLRRLSRETGDPSLDETARRLEDAARAMRQSAAGSPGAGGAESARALDRLNEARRRLETARARRALRDAEAARERAADLVRQQRAVEDAVRRLPPDGAGRTEGVQRLRERKDRMTAEAQEMERSLDRAAQGTRADQPGAAQELAGAADHIRESKLKEKLQYSRGTIETYDAETAMTLELSIEGDLQALKERLDRAVEAAAAPPAKDPLKEALEDTRDLLRSMEAMDRRLRQPGDPAAEARGTPSRDGTPGDNPPAGARAQDALSGNGPPRNVRRPSADEIRQFQREMRRRSEEVRDLRRKLGEAGRDGEELDGVLRAMRRLQVGSIYDNPAQVARLQEDVLLGLKGLEFGLRRAVEGGGGRAAVFTGSDDVPDGYRALVEEYYRALARTRGGHSPPGDSPPHASR